MVTLYELCGRDVVSIKEGAKIGKPGDLNINENSAEVYELIVYGRLKWFGLLGREDDIHIPWSDIATIGTDVILVNTDVTPFMRRSKKLFDFQ